jgi:hypothetical protein
MARIREENNSVLNPEKLTQKADFIARNRSHGPTHVHVEQCKTRL